jgi:hypothetical protein
MTKLVREGLVSRLLDRFDFIYLGILPSNQPRRGASGRDLQSGALILEAFSLA